MNHYYTQKPSSKSNEKLFKYNILEKEFRFYCDNGVFSKYKIDTGTNLLLETIIKKYKKSNISIDEISLLDVGCGYGSIGVVLAKFFKTINVTMIDINERAINLSLKNIKKNNIKNIKVFTSNSFDNVEENYNIIVTNPPIRAGKKVVYDIFERSFKHLKKDGEFYSVIQNKQGAPSAKNKLLSIFENCEIIAHEKGYKILYSKKQ